MATLVEKAQLRWEMHHPLGLGIAGAILCLFYGPYVYSYSESSGWKLDQLYICIFTIATVYTVFLFTFYTFVIATERGFIARSKHTHYFRQTVKYTIGAMASGSALCFASIPLLVVQPIPKAGDLWLFFVAFWVALAIGASASFIRAAYLFAIFARNQAGP